MSANFNIKSFGYNVIPDAKDPSVAQRTMENTFAGLWAPVENYFDANESVFSGEVLSEINKLNLQTMKLGTIVNADRVTRNLDTNI